LADRSYNRLDNPVGYSLNENHRSLAIGNGLARRYPADTAPFVALAEDTAAGFADLAKIVSPGEAVPLVSPLPPAIPANWQVVRQRNMVQMVYDQDHSPVAPQTLFSFNTLTEKDVPAILALVELTRPGPFLPRTIGLGSYVAVCDGPKIAAMAGERFSLEGFREISAVCTHPDYQKRGYGTRLINYLIAKNLQAGSLPFLHVFEDNPAKQLYETLHFRQRKILTLSVIMHS